MVAPKIIIANICSCNKSDYKFGEKFVRDDYMDMVYVEDCCEILDSLRVPITASHREEGAYPYYGANGIQDYVADYIFDDDLVLLAEDGGNFCSKDRAIAYRVSGKCWVNNHAHVLKPKAGMDVDYLCYSLMFYKVDGMVNGATRQKLTQAAMRKMQIPLRSMDEQVRIADELNRVIKIKEQRQQELGLLDDLIKARFVEMFGDIKTNEYGWEKCTFKDVSTKITDGEHGTVPRVDEGEGYLYFMARNITREGEIDLSETSFVPREIHEKIYKRCNPEKDDLLLVCVGATIGKCTLVSEIMGEFSMARSVALIKPNKEMVTSNFLINLLRSEAIQNDIDHCSHAAAQAGLYTNMINSLEAFVPPMDLQIEFDTFCDQVNKSKAMNVI